MDNFVLILALGLIAVAAIVILVARGARKEVNKIEHEHENQPPRTYQPGHSHVYRETTLDAPPQHHQGTSRKVTIDMLAMPDMTGVTPAAGKGIDGIIAWVMNPVVKWHDTGEEVHNFEPPLSLTVGYTAEDVQATTLDDKGIPRLALILAYQSDDGWKWERMHTRVEPSSPGGPGTLSCKIHTLHPKDPVAIGRP